MIIQNALRFLVKFKNDESVSNFNTFNNRNGNLPFKCIAKSNNMLGDSYISVLETEESLDNISMIMQNNKIDVEKIAKDETFNIAYNIKPKGLKAKKKIAQWNLDAIKWNLPHIETLIGVPENNITIAIIDSGINKHFELEGCIVDNKCFAPNMNEDKHIKDNINHGTAVAGIIASLTGNGGINGVFPGVKIMNIKVNDNKQLGWFVSAIYKGIMYAANSNAKIINVSWSYEDKEKALLNVSTDPKTGAKYFIDNAIDEAYKKGKIIVFSLGDSNKLAKDVLPDNYDKIIVVGACNQKLEKLKNSNIDEGIETIYAPGDNIETLHFKNNKYAPQEGSSFAAPHVSALIGLILLKNPNLSFKEIKKLLFENATIGDKNIKIINISKTLKNTPPIS